MTDWTYETAFQAALKAKANAQTQGGPPQADNILVNGTAKNKNGGGSWNKVSIQSGKKYRLRLINTSVDANLLVSLDQHPFQVIATDFVPVEPYSTNYIQIGIGQRYDVIINANQTAGNYWFRSAADANCQSSAAREGRAIFTYAGQTVADPSTSALPNPPTGCFDPVTTPKIVKNVPSNTFAAQSKSMSVALGPVSVQNNTVLWTVNGSSQIVDPGNPTIKYVAEQNNSFPKALNLIDVPSTSANTWTYWIIQQATGAPPIAHPIHLHGHDSYILGQGVGQFNAANDMSKLRFTNPPRRDVAQLPGSGWLVLAYPTDNPGAWVMHCHIAFHVGMGLSVQFLERKQSINLPAPGGPWYENCKNWAAYQASGKAIYPQDDSALKRRWPALGSEGPMSEW